VADQHPLDVQGWHVTNCTNYPLTMT